MCLENSIGLSGKNLFDLADSETNFRVGIWTGENVLYVSAFWIVCINWKNSAKKIHQFENLILKR